MATPADARGTSHVISTAFLSASESRVLRPLFVSAHSFASFTQKRFLIQAYMWFLVSYFVNITLSVWAFRADF